MRTHKRWLTVGAVLVALLLVSAIPVSADPGTTWYVNVALGTNNDVCGQNPGAFACKTIEYVLHDRWVPAQPGDTIVVAAGVYPESIVIDIPNLTVKGPQFGVDPTVAGARTVVANEAIITGDGVKDYSVRIGRDTDAVGGGTGVTFDGFLLRGEAVKTTRAIYANRDGPTIRNNIIEVANFAGDGIFLAGEHRVIDSATISHNYIYGTVTSLRAAIRVDSYDYAGTQVTIKNVAISGNKIVGTTDFYDDGIMLARSTGTALAVSNVSITDNLIQGIGGGGSAGIDIYSSAGAIAGVKDVTITGNTIDPWAWGIIVDYLKLGVVDATTIAVHYNSIVGNTKQVENAGTGVLNAECNWWGAVGSPFAGMDGLVDFTPWTTLALSAVDGKAEANGSDAEEITASLVCGGSAVPAGHPLDFTKVDFQTDLGFFTLTLQLQDVEANVPLVDGEAAVKLYSQWVGRAKVDVSPAGEADWVEEENLVTFYPEKPFISYPPHRSTISERRPLFRWTASPAADEGVRLFYRLRLVKARPLPKELAFKARTDLTSYQSPRLAGKVYVLRVRACAKFFDPTVTVCSRWARSRFRIR